jgi:hypothetical protein
MVEVNVAVVCACLVTIKALLSKTFPRWLGPSSGDGRLQTGGEEEPVETIGWAPRRMRRNIIDSDLLADDATELELLGSNREGEFRIKELKAPAGGGHLVLVRIAPPDRAVTRSSSRTR